MTYNLDVIMGGVEPCFEVGPRGMDMLNLMVLGVEPFWDCPTHLRWLTAFWAERWSEGVLWHVSINE